MGTRFTMQAEFYQKAFLKAGIVSVVPPVEYHDFIQNKIFSELVRGIIKKETHDKFLKIIMQMIRMDHIETLVLACTELSLLFNSEMPEIDLIDTATEHINRIVQIALNRS